VIHNLIVMLIKFVHIYIYIYILHSEEFPAVLLLAGNGNVKQLLYTIVWSLMMGQ